MLGQLLARDPAALRAFRMNADIIPTLGVGWDVDRIVRIANRGGGRA